MNPLEEYQRNLTRRQLLTHATRPLGAAALATLIKTRPGYSAKQTPKNTAAPAGLQDLPHFAPRAKQVIYLFMCGGPSHIDTFDFKPALRKFLGPDLPASVRQGHRSPGRRSGLGS